MRKRGILLRKNNNYIERIGLIGVDRGVGVTYIGLMMALYMSEYKGLKTAFIEVNENRDMEEIQKAYYWDRIDENSFSFNKLTCYKSIKEEDLSEILSLKYEVFILDFANHLSQEFTKCNRKFIICNHCRWKHVKIFDFIKAFELKIKEDKATYIITNSTKKTVVELRKKLEGRIVGVPYVEEASNLSKDLVKVFNQLFK